MIKKGDIVKILIGKDKNKTGKIIQVYPKEGKVTVHGLNIYKKHSKPKKQGEKGETINIVRPMNVSNVAIVCSACGKTTRIGYKVSGDKKIRQCVKCKASI